VNDLFGQLKAAIERRLRGPDFSGLLRRFGIDPRRYWLLMDLFHKLSTREEMQGQLGRQTRALRFSAIYSFIVSGIIAVLFIPFGGTARTLAAISLGLTAFTLIAVLLSEAANSLVNPDEALALAHQPINGATYTGAKLSHLLNIVLHYVLGWNLIPAVVTAFLIDGRWFYPGLHLTAASILGLLLALFCCSIFGLLMRVVPARRMKSAAQFVQAIPAVLFAFLRFSPRGTLLHAYSLAILAVAPLEKVPRWLLAVTAVTVAAGITVVGLRSLSGDYLIRVSAMVHGKSDATTRVRRSLLGNIVRRLFGGQAGRAGFDYVKKMMLRDWQFRRQLLSIAPMLFFMVVGVLSTGLPSPFGTGFSSAHFAPHVLGFFLFMVCMTLPYGTDYKGVWLFLLVSDSALDRFSRGIHASLWLAFIIVPNVLLLGLFIWRWGVTDAIAFTLFSVAVTSVYLACGLRSIEGVPFGRQISSKQIQGNQGGARLLFFMIAAAIAVGIQYVLFRSVAAVWISTLVIGGAAAIITRKSLSVFHGTMVYHLGVASQTATMIYKEVGVDDEMNIGI
jgi:hypothetical protein